jgi:Alw26I/Eco31I/Esp3I family type II restriction endonuclease
MERNERTWHPNFIKYMEFIANHKNYEGLPIERKNNGGLSWIATAKNKTGIARKAWALKKAYELKIPNNPGVYAKVMLEVHPTKKKVCQVCGKEMSLFFVYPNRHMIIALKKAFNYECTMTTHVNDIIKDLLARDIKPYAIKQFLLEKFSLKAEDLNFDLNKVIKLCENKCRDGHSRMLGPGAMSDFPDRYDGFHTYNRCCRALEDTGRSKDNLKSYTKDRRAYEFWSDANIHAANKFMGSSFFKNSSADHIGPISLGFVHDSYYLRLMPKGDNSSKRDRLLYEDIKEIISVEQRSKVYAMSWYSSKLWEFIKLNYDKQPHKIEDYRIALKQNMANFMLILWTIKTNCGDKGKVFLTNNLLAPKMEYFTHDYKFNNLGEIISKKPRNITDSTRKEFDRFVRIAFKAVDDYQEKENRNVKTCLNSSDEFLLKSLCKDILNGKDDQANYCTLAKLLENIQDEQIKQL